jgi:prepilin-type processing-associated H-X9-DG protein
LKELGLSLQLYVDDSLGYFPPRRGNNRWPTLLQDSYRNTNMIVCPTDILRGKPATDTSSPTPADQAPRSYFINGWNDYFSDNLSASDFNLYMAGTYPQASLKQNSVLKSSDTVILGEKQNQAMDYFMDMLEGAGGNDADRVEHGMHGRLNPNSKGVGSNYAFADGSARYLKYGTETYPLNMWAITDANRVKYAFQPP